MEEIISANKYPSVFSRQVEATLGRIEDFRKGSSRYGTLKAVHCIGGWSRGHSSPDFLNGISGILRQGSVLIVSLFSLIYGVRPNPPNTLS